MRSALTFFSEGIYLLSDHHFRLSLARRAFTKPSFNIIGKNAAEAVPIDQFSFGQNFAETLKAAQACEKTWSEISKSSSLVGKKTLQPVRQQVHQERSKPSTFNRSVQETGGLLFLDGSPIRSPSFQRPSPALSVSTPVPSSPLRSVSTAGRLRKFFLHNGQLL